MKKSKSFRNPFPGIRSYKAGEEEIFFGREKHIGILKDHIFKHHFLALTGSSGCGKSSLINAGLIPSLTASGTGPESIDYSLMRPGNNPLGQLAESLYVLIRKSGQGGEIPGVNSAEMLEKNLRAQPSLLNDILQENIPHGKSILLIVDQFEEIFRYKISRDFSSAHADAELFTKLLFQPFEAKSNKYYLLISMRSDFLDDCSEFPQLTSYINKGHYLVPRMEKEEIRQAISGPVKYMNAAISDELVESLLEETGLQSDQLPVLQHALMRTWDHCSEEGKVEKLDISHYKAVGGMAHALSLHAEEIYDELENNEQKRIAERLFKTLVHAGEKARGTRRPAVFSGLCKTIDAPPSQIRLVIDKFREEGRAFLTPSWEQPIEEDSVIDISHESLMRTWKRLKVWIEEERSSVQLYLRLSRSAELYQSGRSGLWVNPELQLAIQWFDNNKPNQTWAEYYDPAFDRAINFLDASRIQAERDIEKKERKLKKDLARARRFAIILGSASIISLLFLVVALNLKFKAEASEKKALDKEKLAQEQSIRAEERSREAIIQKKISEQQQQIAEQQKLITERQKQYAIDQQNIARQERQEALLQKGIADKARVQAVEALDEAKEQRQEAIHQKQQAEMAREEAETSETRAQRLRMIALARSAAIQASEMAVTMEDDNLPPLLARQAWLFNSRYGGNSWDADITEALMNTAGMNKISRLHSDEVRALAFINNKSLATGAMDGKVMIIPAKGKPSEAYPLKTTVNKGIRCMASRPESSILCAGTQDGQLLLWKNTARDSKPESINISTSFIADCDIHSSAGIICADNNGNIIHYSFDGNKKKLFKSPSKIHKLRFYKDGKAMIWCNDKGKVFAMDFRSMAAMPVLLFETDQSITALAISHNGEFIAIGCRNGIINVFNANNKNKAMSLIGHISGVNALVFHPDSNMLASGSYDRSIRIWNLNELSAAPIIIQKHDLWVYDLAFSPDGDKLASASADKSTGVYAIIPKNMAEEICRKTQGQIDKKDWTDFFGNDIPWEKTCSSLTNKLSNQ